MTAKTDDRPVLIRPGAGLYPYTCRVGTFEAVEVKLMPPHLTEGRHAVVIVWRTRGGSGLWEVGVHLSPRGRGDAITVHAAAGRALSPLRFMDLHAAVTFTAIRAAERAHRSEPREVRIFDLTTGKLCVISASVPAHAKGRRLTVGEVGVGERGYFMDESMPASNGPPPCDEKAYLVMDGCCWWPFRREP